jgi:hypothetical protein
MVTRDAPNVVWFATDAKNLNSDISSVQSQLRTANILVNSDRWQHLSYALRNG